MSFSGWLNSIGFTDQAALTPVQRVNLLMLYSVYHPDAADAFVPSFSEWRISKGFTDEAELNETQLANLRQLFETEYPEPDTEPAGASPSDFAQTSAAVA
jgi:hypothetical protein